MANSPDFGLIAGVLVIAAISFNAVLCFLNTRGVPISSLHVMMSEAVLISAALLSCRNYLNVTRLTILALIVGYTIALSALRYANEPANGFDPKISRDLIIPVTFFLLGTLIDNVKVADKVVFIATTILLVFAAFEYFFLETFLKIFGVAQYYIARGTVEESDWALDVSQGSLCQRLSPRGPRPNVVAVPRRSSRLVAFSRS